MVWLFEEKRDAMLVEPKRTPPPLVHHHSGQREGGGGQLHDDLHLHLVTKTIINILEDNIHEWKIDDEEEGGAENGKEAEEVVGGGDVRGCIRAGAEGNEDEGEGDVDDAVEVGEADLLAKEEDREGEVEDELGRRNSEVVDMGRQGIHPPGYPSPMI